MILGVSVAVLSTAALAQSGKSGVNVGSLQCRVSGGMGFIFRSSKDLDCLFVRPDGVAAVTLKPALAR
jgi:hypothetical protein